MLQYLRWQCLGRHRATLAAAHQSSREMTLEADQLKQVFRDNLRARRRELGLSQAGLAELMKVNQSYVSQLESGLTSPQFETIANVSDALSTTPDALLKPGTFSSPTAIPSGNESPGADEQSEIGAARAAKLGRLGMSEDELARLTPPREHLERLAARFVPPAEWFEEDDVA